MTDPAIVALAMTKPELALVRRAVSEVVDREGWSVSAINVLEMATQRLGEPELGTDPV
jgi:hypothetical protein